MLYKQLYKALNQKELKLKIDFSLYQLSQNIIAKNASYKCIKKHSLILLKNSFYVKSSVGASGASRLTASIPLSRADAVV